MHEKIQPVTEKQLKRAARNHANAVIAMYNAHNRVAITLGCLVEIMGRADDAPFAGGTLSERADKAMGDLGKAYEQVAALFDSL